MDEKNLDVYKTILEAIIKKNECTIAQDAALQSLRNKDTFEYVKSIEIDPHGWVYNELSNHTRELEPETDLIQLYQKAYEQNNVFGSVNYIVNSPTINPSAKKIEMLKSLSENGYRCHYYLCCHLGALYLGELYLAESKYKAAYYFQVSASSGYGPASHFIAIHLATQNEKYAILEDARLYGW